MFFFLLWFAGGVGTKLILCMEPTIHRLTPLWDHFLPFSYWLKLHHIDFPLCPPLHNTANASRNDLPFMGSIYKGRISPRKYNAYNTQITVANPDIWRPMQVNDDCLSSKYFQKTTNTPSCIFTIPRPSLLFWVRRRTYITLGRSGISSLESKD